MRLQSIDDFEREKPLSLSQGLIAGGVAGLFASIFISPIELIKCRQQVIFERHPKENFMQLGMKLFRSGLLLRGLFITMCREVPGSAVFFGIYELSASYYDDETNAAIQHLAPIAVANTPALSNPSVYNILGHNRHVDCASNPSISSDTTQPTSAAINEYKRRHMSHYELMVTGFVAGTAYWLLFFPIDLIKSQIQITDTGGILHHLRITLNLESPSRPNSTDSLMGKVKRLKNLYRGLLPSLLRGIPENVPSFLVYDVIFKYLTRLGI